MPFAPLVVWFALRRVPIERRGGYAWITSRRREGVVATLLAMTPLLLPAATYNALAAGEPGAWWDARISAVGLVGIAYHVEMPWRLTTALLAAWGLDRFFGWPRSRIADGVTAVFVVATIVFGVIGGIERTDLGIDVHHDYWSTGTDDIPRGDLPHAMPLVHLTAGAAAALALVRRRRSLSEGLVTALFVGLALFAGRVAIADHGPWIAADVSAGVGLVLVAAHAALLRRDGAGRAV